MKKQAALGSVSSSAQLDLSAQQPTIGVFYHNKMRHLCEYVPYAQPPTTSLCDVIGSRWWHWTSTRTLGNLCPECAKIAENKFGKLKFK